MDFKVIFLLIFLFDSFDCELREFAKWQQIDYANLPYNKNSSFFIQYNNVPQGFAPYKDKIFIAVPRRNIGIPSTLNYIKLDGRSHYVNPKLESYPDFETNDLDPNLRYNPNKIISVYRPKIDECDRLWFIDTGILQVPGMPNRVIQRPSIWVIDLSTDRVVRRFEIPESVVPDGIGLVSINIDVTDNYCENTFAYIPDLATFRLIVYSLKENKSWRFRHNYFFLNPFEGEFFIDGRRFAWNDGIFSITLGERFDQLGHRTAFFHALGSTSELGVSTQVLRNETLSQREYHGEDFKYVGNRGLDSQSAIHGYDPITGVIFFASINKNAVACWNTKNTLKPEVVGLVYQNNETLIYPNDLKVDFVGNLWVMSNRMPRFIYSRLDTKDFNFRLYTMNTADVVQGTVCSHNGIIQSPIIYPPQYSNTGAVSPSNLYSPQYYNSFFKF